MSSEHNTIYTKRTCLIACFYFSYNLEGKVPSSKYGLISLYQDGSIMNLCTESKLYISMSLSQSSLSFVLGFRDYVAILHSLRPLIVSLDLNSRSYSCSNVIQFHLPSRNSFCTNNDLTVGWGTVTLTWLFRIQGRKCFTDL